MPQVRYGGANGTSFELEESRDMLAVRTHSGRSIRGLTMAGPDTALLEDLEMLVEFPEAGVEVYRHRGPGRESRKTIEQARSRLRESADTRFAGRVLMEPRTGEPVVYTENLFVKFQDDCTESHCTEILAELGLSVKRQLPYARNAWFVATPEGTGQRVFDIAMTMQERDDIELCHPELVRRREHKTVFPQQWHLMPTTLNGIAVNASASVEAAHAVTEGEGTTIAVIDDGFDVDHEEFSSPGKITAPRDMRFPETDPRHTDPRPAFRNNHGTACAGVACGDGRFGASGVAPRARLMPIRSVSALGSQAEADAFQWAADHGADVISCSWGPPDGNWSIPSDPAHEAVVRLPDSTRLAIEYAVQNGRGGRGCVIFWAAGNGNESVDNDGYASHPQVFAVAATNDRGRRSVYSDFGDAVFCSFPSNDFGFPPFNQPQPLTPGIWTTDRSGRLGYNDGDLRLGDRDGNYTNGFGGTSSACPGAAGVAALVLSVNPELRWEQVGEIIRQSCDRVDPQGGQYDEDGRSPQYGYGRVNAENAVRLATPSMDEESVVVTSRFAAPIHDFRTTEVRLDVGESRAVRRVNVLVDLLHTYIGDLVVTLIPPDGTGVGEIVLHNRTGRSANNIRRIYDAAAVSALQQLEGTVPQGLWRLRITDRARRDRGLLRQFGLELFPASSREAGNTTEADDAESEPTAPRSTGRRSSRRRKTAAAETSSAEVASPES